MKNLKKNNRYISKNSFFQKKKKDQRNGWTPEKSFTAFPRST